jgi:hypothetical protein
MPEAVTEEKEIKPEILLDVIKAVPRGLSFSEMAAAFETTPEAVAKAMHELKLQRAVFGREMFVSDEDPQPGDAREVRWFAEKSE